MDNVKEAWQMWDEAVAGAVFGGFETLFRVDIRSSPCPHTVDLFAVRTPTILVTWALAYLAIVFVGLLTIKPADKSAKVRDAIAWRILAKLCNPSRTRADSRTFRPWSTIKPRP